MTSNLQAGSSVPDEVRAIFEAPETLSFLSTVGADGSPQVTLVRAAVSDAGDEIVIAHMNMYQKIRNMRRDPRVVLSVQAPGGMQQAFPYLTITGTATVTEGGAVELLSRIMAQDAARQGRPAPPPPPMQPEGGGFITHITPLRYGGRGPWAPGSMPPLPPRP
jgi:PPOX class probable F420-dependent enzyme